MQTNDHKTLLLNKVQEVKSYYESLSKGDKTDFRKRFEKKTQKSVSWLEKTMTGKNKNPSQAIVVAMIEVMQDMKNIFLTH